MFRTFTNNNNKTCKRIVATAIQREQSKCWISRILPSPSSKGFREAEVGCTVVTEETLKEILNFEIKPNIIHYENVPNFLYEAVCGIHKNKNIEVGENYRALKPQNNV